MRIVIAPNAFKGSLTAQEATDAIAKGIKRVLPDADLTLIPVADGGDGVLEILGNTQNMNQIHVLATDPSGSPISTFYRYNQQNKLAIIEMASVAGLALLKEDQFNPLITTTFGVGELIKSALDQGARHIIIGIGGSATNDAGIGMASALGIKFYNSSGKPVQGIGQSLIEIQHIDLNGIDSRISNTKLEVICDVDNPLYGNNGAAYVYAPQKGASPSEVISLDKGLRHIAKIIHRELDIDVHNLPGAGAAGGLGAGLHAFTHAILRKGIDVVIDHTKIDEAIKVADLVITGEGKFDFQTHYGKAPAGIAKRAQRYNVPCILLAGTIEIGLADYQQQGFSAIFSICPGPMDLKTAISYTARNLSDTSQQIISAILLGMKINKKPCN